ncbi:MAG: Ni/Fe-hydrogenase cytochrome b subunit [Planctomycetes bacterium]|nr:Ni/Fe-hydrogenase cytochrome b subunit [Planctomycetota bacterium]
MLCGVALAAGGFTLAAMVHLFGLTRFHPILHSTILTAFLGYVLVSVGLIYDLGKPYHMWHVMIMWNPHSVMFEVAWCVMLYTTVLFLEFVPIVLKRLGWVELLRPIKTISLPLVLAGVILSTLHQSSLGTMFLVVPGKLYKLWYTPYLPVMFFFSAVMVGFAMVIFESYLSSHFFKHGLEKHIIIDLAHFLLLATVFYLAIKFQDLFARGTMGALFEGRLETYCFWLEISLLLIPAVALTFRPVRWSEHASFLCATSVVLGVVVNRLNVAMVGTYASTGSLYLPSFCEIAITLLLVTSGVVAFGLAVKYLDIFEDASHGAVRAPGTQER